MYKLKHTFFLLIIVQLILGCSNLPGFNTPPEKVEPTTEIQFVTVTNTPIAPPPIAPAPTSTDTPIAPQAVTAMPPTPIPTNTPIAPPPLLPTDTPVAPPPSPPTVTSTTSALPDLVITGVGVTMRGYTGGCVTQYNPLIIQVCVLNQGLAPASSFAIRAEPSFEWRIQSLRTDEQLCLEGESSSYGQVLIDIYNEIVEIEEGNNWQYVPIPTPPPICAPPPTFTDTPIAPPPVTLTATPTDTPIAPPLAPPTDTPIAPPTVIPGFTPTPTDTPIVLPSPTP